jgi:hypothetical protein
MTGDKNSPSSISDEQEARRNRNTAEIKTDFFIDKVYLKSFENYFGFSTFQ